MFLLVTVGFKFTKFTWLKVYKNTRSQGYKATRLQGYKFTRMQSYKITIFESLFRMILQWFRVIYNDWKD